MLRLEHLTEESVGKIVPLGPEFANEAKGLFEFNADCFVRHWTQYLQLNVGVVLAVFDDDRVVGTLGLILGNDFMDDAPTMAEAFFYVSQPYRTQKVGTMLLDAAIRIAEAKGTKRFMMASINNTDTEIDVGKMYARRGFQATQALWIKRF